MKRETRNKTNGAAAFPKAQNLTDGIARRAYEIWLNEGCCPGRDLDHWLRAERELVGGLRQDSAQTIEP